MSEQHIILVSSSPLLMEIFHRAIAKDPGFQIAAEVTEVSKVPAMIHKKSADWVIYLLPPEGDSTEQMDSFAIAYPSTQFLTIKIQDGNTKIKRTKVQEEILSKDLSLNDLAVILRKTATRAQDPRQRN